MAVYGFAGHVAYNRRRSLLFIGLYCLTFIPVALLALGIVPILLGDAMHSLFVDPLHYGPTFLPLAIVLALTILAVRYFGLRREVADVLAIRTVTAREEPRFVRIGEEQALLQGLASPEFGVIETAARNAISIGATSGQRMIAVTRGLLDALDDDEVAAVIAHELAHFRAGDASFLTLNHALMRTAELLQVHNPIKIEQNIHKRVQWHLVISIVLPMILPVLAMGGMVTMYATKLARRADASVRAARDFIADAEALRITHFPEALETAIAKCESQGYFPEAERFEAMLFAGNPIAQGGTHPAPRDRYAEIGAVAGELYMPRRQRRDTRTQRTAIVFGGTPALGFGRRGLELAVAKVGAQSFAEANRRSREPLREPGLWLFYALIFDPKSYRAWQRANIDQLKWRADDNRNFLGATPLMTVWFILCFAANMGFYISISTSPKDFLERYSGHVFFTLSDEAAGALYCDPTEPECKAKGTFHN